jgi:hypothetical protein
MQGHRLAGVVVLGLLTTVPAMSPVLHGADAVAGADTTVPLFRVFLKDGSSLVSYGELARVAERVVFSMPTQASTENPELHLVDIAADRVDWTRTTEYAESARAAQYARTRGDADYALLTSEIAQALNDVGLTQSPVERLAIVQRARKTLADWPAAHYNYKQDDIRKMLGMLDEAIAELGAATGAERFNLSLVAVAEPARRAGAAMLPAPTVQELIEQTLLVAKLADSAAERTSLLSVAIASIDRHKASLPPEWATVTRQKTAEALAAEMAIDRSYDALSRRIVGLAAARARAADVRGVQRVLADMEASDAALGRLRPDTISALYATVEAHLDSARRLRLDRDRWLLRLPELRQYRTAMSSVLQRLTDMMPALEDIKALSGSGPDEIGSILKWTSDIQRAVSRVPPPEELRQVHELLVTAARLAENAARVRREAALTGSMDRAWNASSAAAGALMLSARARSELLTALQIPQLR